MSEQTLRKYEIQVRGHLDESWSQWFDDFLISYPNERTTLLSGQPKDQAQLHAILIKIRDLNLMLISVNPIHDIRGEVRGCPSNQLAPNT